MPCFVVSLAVHAAWLRCLACTCAVCFTAFPASCAFLAVRYLVAITVAVVTLRYLKLWAIAFCCVVHVLDIESVCNIFVGLLTIVQVEHNGLTTLWCFICWSCAVLFALATEARNLGDCFRQHCSSCLMILEFNVSNRPVCAVCTP